jgi:adenosylcobinamide amidohydrolase
VYLPPAQPRRNQCEAILLCRPDDRLVWSFSVTQRVLSWTIYAGGYQNSDSVVWLQVSNDDLPIGVSPLDCIQKRVQPGPSTPVFLTSARIAAYGRARAQQGLMHAEAVVTVGLGNALRAGDPIDIPPYFGTINLACAVSLRISDAAMIEALCIMTEAKTAALYDAGIKSRVSGLNATGTGTDCQAVLCPMDGAEAIYAGKHTGIGSVIGAASYQALREGIHNWQIRQQHSS